MFADSKMALGDTKNSEDRLRSSIDIQGEAFTDFHIFSTEFKS